MANPFAKLTNPRKPEPSPFKCPECNSTMYERTNRSTGEVFHGCSQYPDCTGTRDEFGDSKMDRAKENYDPGELDGTLRFRR